MTQRVPNLFLVGAMRAGTTALHEVLAAHPDCFMSARKEPAYFADPVELADDSPAASEGGFAGNRARYLDLFKDAGDAAYVGEASTHYTKQPRITGVARRIASAAPDARILYIVRDPIERTLSHYRYAVRKKYERRPCGEALRDEPIYCAVSDYARQLEPYLDRFGEEQVYWCVLEELTEDPNAELGRLFAWLDLDPPAEFIRFRQRNALASRVRRTRGPEFLHSAGRSSFYRTRLRPSIPENVLALIRRGLHRPVSLDDVRTPEILDYLNHIHRPHIEAFEGLAGRSIESWRRPGPASPSP